MKRILWLSILTFLLGLSISAQTPRTVTDYFLAFPDDKYATDAEGNKLKNKAAITKFRRSLIKTQDIKNGYLKLEGAWEGWAEIALFKKKDGTFLIGHAESGCGPACTGFVKFYTYKSGQWKDVTSDVFPELTELQINEVFKAKNIDLEDNGTSHYFVLPQVGTTVKMACNMCQDGEEANFILMEFAWNGEKFTIKK